MKWRVLIWCAGAVAALAAVALVIDVAVAGWDQAAGVAGVVVAFCELAAFALGVAAWAGESRRTAATSATTDPAVDTPGSTVPTTGVPVSAAPEGAGKYTVDARDARAVQIGDGNVQHNDVRPPTAGS